MTALVSERARRGPRWLPSIAPAIDGRRWKIGDEIEENNEKLRLEKQMCFTHNPSSLTMIWERFTSRRCPKNSIITSLNLLNSRSRFDGMWPGKASRPNTFKGTIEVTKLKSTEWSLIFGGMVLVNTSRALRNEYRPYLMLRLEMMYQTLEAMTYASWK